MEQINAQSLSGRVIEWQDRDIISVLKDMGVQYDMDDAILVDVESMPSDIRKVANGLVTQRACFYNAAMMVSVLRRGDMKYVIGYASSPVPFEHAWIRVGELYYDPTWEIYDQAFGSEYLSLCEMGWEELEKTMTAMKMDKPPDLVTLRRFKRMRT